MDGVSVERAIGRDRIRAALKRYENRPTDEHKYGIVRAVNADGSYEVQLDGDVQPSRCSPFAAASVGERVLVVTKRDGTNDLLGRLGGGSGGGTSAPDSGFAERDPTVPAWAKQPNPPTYTAASVGAYTKAETDTAISEAVKGLGGGSSGMFALEVDSDGNLYCVYEDEGSVPSFELDESGNLYYVIEE